MTDKTTDRADLLGACMMEEVRHCDPVRIAAEAMREDFGIYCEVGDLIGSGIDNAYTTIVTERAAQAEEFGGPYMIRRASKNGRRWTAILSYTPNY